VIGLTIGLVIGGFVRQSPAPRPNQLVAVPYPRLTEIGKKLGTTVLMPASPWRMQEFDEVVTADPPATDDLAHYRPLLTAELERYPAGLLKRGGIRRLLLVQHLAADGEPLAGFTSVVSGRLYLALDPDDWTRGNLGATVHHELMHMIDDTFGPSEEDPEWEACNPPGFKYMGNDAGYSDTSEWPPPKGFASRYGRMDVVEDKAELFSMVMIKAKPFAELAKTDPYLAKKMRLMERRLKAAKARPTGWPTLPAPTPASAPGISLPR
jgi:hypothetical protein